VKRPPALLFDVPVADLTMSETLELIDELVAIGRRRGTTHQISTVNVDFLVNALDDADTASILRRADVCLADGMPVVWGSRLLGMPIRERVAGSDLVPLLVDASRMSGHHVHVFGSTPPVADAARRLLQQRYPGAHFSIDPGPVLSDVDHVDDEVLEAIMSVEPDILCVALGNPKQERFIRANRKRLGTPVLIGVGGSLDMLVGKRKRAPQWMQALGMEWIVRAVQEPRRLGRRYAHDIRVFGPRFVGEWRSSHRRRSGTGLRLDVGDDVVACHLRGLDVPAVDEWCAAAKSIGSGATLSVDLASTATAQDRTLAQLLGLLSLARRLGRRVSVIGLDEPLEVQLRERDLLHFFVDEP
jgi:N-acetylglucosaminyldiphosphoundecaprenol N-acetyl-beta-D-mannosaminyltransferase